MPRFFYPAQLAIGNQITLPEQLVRHIHVLRLKISDTIHLFNGEGGCFAVTLNEIGKREANATVKVFFPDEVELPYALTLAQALPESSKMDWIIEKAVELGVSTIQPLAAQRCVVKLNGERSEKRRQHWQGIITAASEQCGRNRLVHLPELQAVEKWLQQQDMHKRILLTPRSEQSLSEWARHHPPQPVTIMIGPEGGFSDEEEAHAMRHGVLPLSMGARILRTETAGLAAIACLNALWGQM